MKQDLDNPISSVEKEQSLFADYTKKSTNIFHFAMYEMISDSDDGVKAKSSSESFKEERVELPSSTENVGGVKIRTWKAWSVANDQPLYVNIVNSHLISEQKLDSVIMSITSHRKITGDSVESSTYIQNKDNNEEKFYFVGWEGAINNVLLSNSNKTLYRVPSNFIVFSHSERKEIKSIDKNPNEITNRFLPGDVVIFLSRSTNKDGFTGYTKSITHNNEILKSFITIYDVDKLTKKQLSATLRHEFGHALGLGHSDTKSDLMYTQIDMQHPYISLCDVEAIMHLYGETIDNDKNPYPSKTKLHSHVGKLQDKSDIENSDRNINSEYSCYK